PTLLTNTLGTQQASYQYDAWGNSRGETGSSDNVFGFTGHEKDTETGLYYFKARYYDPDTARFLNQDSYLGDVNTPPSLHRYLYAYGNPTVWIDPDGHESFLSDWNEASEERVQNYTKQIENAESGWGAVGLGFMRGFSQLESAIATGMNATSNLGAQGFSEKARTELAATRSDLTNGFETTEKTAKYVKNNPVATVKAVHQGAVNFTVDVASGDRKALGNLGGMLTPIPGTVAKSAGKGIIGATGTLVEAATSVGTKIVKNANAPRAKGKIARQRGSVGTKEVKRINVGNSGHHVPAVRKSKGRGFEVKRSDKDRPTIHFKGNDPGNAHWQLHNAEKKYVGKRQGDFKGSDQELIDAYKKSYKGLDDIKVDVRSPNNKYKLGEDMTPQEAVNCIECYLKDKGMLE
ncbi:MAG: RHS repeat-associated core domain-containing protein, partial [Methylococcaceae bacterium]